MNEENVNQSIMTTRDGNKITKVCLEDIHKIMDRVIGTIDKKLKSIVEIYSGLKGEEMENGKLRVFVRGTGVSKPCGNDEFDEELGNNIAFMKAKLNANIKKHNLLCRTYNCLVDMQDAVDEDLYKVDEYIKMDLESLRMYNPDYLYDLEDKLGIE